MIGPIQCAQDSWILCYIVSRWDPLYEKKKEEARKKALAAGGVTEQKSGASIAGSRTDGLKED